MFLNHAQNGNFYRPFVIIWTCVQKFFESMVVHSEVADCGASSIRFVANWEGFFWIVVKIALANLFGRVFFFEAGQRRSLLEIM